MKSKETRILSTLCWPRPSWEHSSRMTKLFMPITLLIPLPVIYFYIPKKSFKSRKEKSYLYGNVPNTAIPHRGEKKQLNNLHTQQHWHIQAINIIFYDGFHIVPTNWTLKLHASINTGGKCRNILKSQIRAKNMLMLIIATYKYVYPLKNLFGINEIIFYEVIYIMKNCFCFRYWLSLRPTF